MAKVWIPTTYDIDGEVDTEGHFEGEDDPGVGTGDFNYPVVPTTPAVPDTGGWTTDEVGNKYKLDAKGNLTFKDAKGTDYTYNTAKGGFTDAAGNLAGEGVVGGLLNKINGALGTNLSVSDLGKLAIGAGGLAGAMGAGNPTVKPTGYQGGIPNLTASQPMLTSPPMGRRPGSGGINYGTGVQYRDKNGNIVSDTSTPVDVLDAAARGNGFNQGANYGQGTTGAGTSNAGLIALLQQIAAGQGGGTAGAQGGGGSPVTTSIASSGGNTPTTKSLATLQADYNAIAGKGTNKDLYSWINKQTAAGYTAADLAKVSGYKEADVANVVKTAGLQASYDTLNKSGGTQNDLYKWVNQQIANGITPDQLAAVSGYKVEDINKVIATAKTSAPAATAAPATGLAALKQSYDTLNKSGGTQNDLYSWVNAQISAGVTPQQLATMTGYNLADVQKVIANAKTASSDTAAPSGVVTAGPGVSSNFQRDYGLKSQGYSRDYSPKELATMEETFKQYRNDPVKLAAMMKEYGVTTKDLALAQGGLRSSRSGDTTALNNIFLGAGISPTDPIFAGNGPATDEQKQFIAWQGNQTDKLGRKISDTWAARGITDPYSDPALVAQANQQVIRAQDRESVGASPSQTRPWSSTTVPTGTTSTGTTSTSTPTPGGGITDLQTAYNALNKAGGTNKDLYDFVNQQTAKGVSAADLAKVSGYGTGDVGNVVSEAKRFAPLEQSYNAIAGTGTPGINDDLYKWVNSQIAAGYNAHDLALASGYNEADVQNVINNAAGNSSIANLSNDIAYETNHNPVGNVYNYGNGMGGIEETKGNYTPSSPDAAGLAALAAQASTPMNSGSTDGIPSAGMLTPPPEPTPFVRGKTPEEEAADAQAAADSYAQSNQWYGFAQGGLTNLDHGGFVIPADVVSHFGNGSSEAGLKLLQHKLGATPIKGHGDGMSDSIPAAIDGREKALVANEEAYISPQMVQRLGGGSMDKGSQKLAHMMEKIRKARTGSKEQGKQVNPNNFMPGGMVGYAQGGGIKSYAGTPDPTASLVQAGVTGTEQNLSNWAGDYTTNMMGKAQGLANTPYQAYTGPLTAGASDLQTQSFNTAANLPVGGGMATDFAQQAGNLQYTPQTTNFDAAQAQKYMNPYLQASLDPQLAEARRQSEITAQQNNAAMTKAGAFGGGRQAIMGSENQRNLGTKLADITGQGYNTAYTNAMGQFNADQNRQMAENQFVNTSKLAGLNAGISGANTANQMGINNLNTQATLGATQRGIEGEGIAADKLQFEEARNYPAKMLQFQQSMLNGMPITSQNYNMSQPSGFQAAAGGMTTVADLLAKLGYKVTP